MLRSFMNREEGQGLVEYALILVLISIAVIVIMGTMSKSIGKVFTDITNSLNNAERPAAAP